MYDGYQNKNTQGHAKLFSADCCCSYANYSRFCSLLLIRPGTKSGNCLKISPTLNSTKRTKTDSADCQDYLSETGMLTVVPKVNSRPKNDSAHFQNYLSETDMVPRF